MPVFILDDERPGEFRHGGAHRWWLHHSLELLSESLAKLGSPLVLRKGDSVAELTKLVAETGAAAIHAIRHYEPWWLKAEADLAAALPEGVTLHLHNGNFLVPPDSVVSGSGKPYRIYAPFAKAAMAKMPPREPLPVPGKLDAPDTGPESDSLADWRLLPTKPDWAGGFRAFWKDAVGEDAALRCVERFRERVEHYATARNLPSQSGSSQLSPHLHWGEVSPATVWHSLAELKGDGGDKFRAELLWRDFTQNIIIQFPDYATEHFRDEFDRFPFRDPDSDKQAAADLEAWRKGRTGYPIVDAGMRQLWETGWMHNRVRMITASFLVKHLLIDWRHGERHYWDMLVDADYGNNAVNWQWIAGSGVDSQQFTRIMAPLGQSEKFDAAAYIRQFVPELAGLSNGEIHDPPHGVRPADYPDPLIGHKEGRERALGAYRAMKAAAS